MFVSGSNGIICHNTMKYFLGVFFEVLKYRQQSNIQLEFFQYSLNMIF